MIISIIAAMAINNIIGVNNKLPWRLPEDLEYFKAMTMGKPMIMGRKTFESLPGILPGRQHIVISRDAEDKPEIAEVDWVSNLDEAVAKAAGYLDATNDEIMIVGGGQIYQQAMDIANKLYITKIDATYSGDAFFPEIDLQKWNLVKEENRFSERSQLKFSLQLYEKR